MKMSIPGVGKWVGGKVMAAGTWKVDALEERGRWVEREEWDSWMQRWDGGTRLAMPPRF